MTLGNSLERCEALLAKMRQQFPELGVSFGYIGNVGVDRHGRYDNRLWMFFTRVPQPDSVNKFRFTSWGVPTKELEVLADEAEKGLEAFLRDKVTPHKDGRWRSFKVRGQNARHIRPQIEKMGGSYGLDGQHDGLFSLRFTTTEQLRERFPGLTFEEE